MALVGSRRTGWFFATSSWSDPSIALRHFGNLACREYFADANRVYAPAGDPVMHTCSWPQRRAILRCRAGRLRSLTRGECVTDFRREAHASASPGLFTAAFRRSLPNEIAFSVELSRRSRTAPLACVGEYAGALHHGARPSPDQSAESTPLASPRHPIGIDCSGLLLAIRELADRLQRSSSKSRVQADVGRSTRGGFPACAHTGWKRSAIE